MPGTLGVPGLQTVPQACRLAAGHRKKLRHSQRLAIGTRQEVPGPELVFRKVTLQFFSRKIGISGVLVPGKEVR